MIVQVTLAGTLLAVCFIYAVAFVFGWRLTTTGRLDPSHFLQARRELSDPLTRRFQRWQGRTRMDAIRQRQWARLWLLIFANNLFAVALISRTLYGATLVLPLYLTWRQGIAQGALVARPSMRPGGALAGVGLLEFGAYFLATALGLNVVISFFEKASVQNAVRLLVLLYPIVAAAVSVGAWLEVRWVRAHMPETLQLPATLTVAELRAKALEMMKRQSNGAAKPAAALAGGRGNIRAGCNNRVRPPRKRAAGDARSSGGPAMCLLVQLACQSRRFVYWCRWSSASTSTPRRGNRTSEITRWTKTRSSTCWGIRERIVPVVMAPA